MLYIAIAMRIKNRAWETLYLHRVVSSFEEVQPDSLHYLHYCDITYKFVLIFECGHQITEDCRGKSFGSYMLQLLGLKPIIEQALSEQVGMAYLFHHVLARPPQQISIHI